MTDARPRCATCGSDDVVRDAWAFWDVAAGRWVFGAMFDQARCEDCDADTEIVWIEQRPKEPTA